MSSFPDLSNIRQITPDLINIETISCKPQIVDLKPVVFDGNSHKKPVRIEKHRTEGNILRLLHLKILNNIGGGKPGHYYILHNEHAFAGNINIDILDNSYHACAGSRVRNI